MGSNTYTEKPEIKPLTPGVYDLDRATGALTVRGPQHTGAKAQPGEVAGDIVTIGEDGIPTTISFGGSVSEDFAKEIVKRVFRGRHFEALTFTPTRVAFNTRGLPISEYTLGASAHILPV